MHFGTRWIDGEEIHSPPHSPPLPAIEAGRRAYSPEYRAHGTVTFVGKVYAQMKFDRNPSTTVSVKTEELIPVE